MRNFFCWLLFFLFFFFSSRRRHTRFDCDWSSDVCSSDLAHTPLVHFFDGAFGIRNQVLHLPDVGVHLFFRRIRLDDKQLFVDSHSSSRSEERRVGKECRSRLSSDRYKEKNVTYTSKAIMY